MQADRSPPYSEEAERGLIGSILLDSAKVYGLSIDHGISCESFYNERLGIVFGAIKQMMHENVGVDILTVSERLKKIGKLDDVGGGLFLEKIIDQTPTSAHAEHYIGIVKDRELRREIIRRSKDSYSSAYNLDEPIEKVIESAQTSFSNIGMVEFQAEGMAELADIAEREWVEGKERGFKGIPSKFDKLNQLLAGYRFSKVCAIGGYRSEGKSILMANEVLFGAQKGYKELIFTLEDTAEEIVQRIIGNLADFSTFKFDVGAWDENEWARFKECKLLVSELPITIKSGAFTIEDIAAKTKQLVAMKGINRVWIDYFQLLTSSRRQENRTKELDYISRTLSLLALSQKISIVVLSQYSRDAEKKGEIPKLSSFRDSGAIENDARQAILIYRDPQDDERHVWEVAKNTKGPRGTVLMKFVGNRQRWREWGAADEPYKGKDRSAYER